MRYTQDWSGARKHWSKMLKDLVGLPNLTFLEIGCYEGMTTVWLLENVLTHPSSSIVVVDTFLGQEEYEQIGVSRENIYPRFLRNTKPWVDAKKIEVWPASSSTVLPQLILDHYGFDFVYVDGSHRATDVLVDGLLCWNMLTENGIMVFDDYEWDVDLPDVLKPKEGVDAFLRIHTLDSVIIHQNYQLAVRKI